MRREGTVGDGCGKGRDEEGKGGRGKRGLREGWNK